MSPAFLLFNRSFAPTPLQEIALFLFRIWSNRGGVITSAIRRSDSIQKGARADVVDILRERWRILNQFEVTLNLLFKGRFIWRNLLWYGLEFILVINIRLRVCYSLMQSLACFLGRKCTRDARGDESVIDSLPPLCGAYFLRFSRFASLLWF